MTWIIIDIIILAIGVILITASNHFSRRVKYDNSLEALTFIAGVIYIIAFIVLEIFRRWPS